MLANFIINIIKNIFKKYYISIFFVFICITGCKVNNHTINLQKIEQLLFQDVQRIEMIITSSKIKVLTNQEKTILQECIRNGSNLTEISDKDMPDVNSDNFVVFIITWKNGLSTDLFYERMNHYMYIYKDQVLFRDKTKYDRLTVEMYNKIMLGVFRFRPCSSIKKIII